MHALGDTGVSGDRTRSYFIASIFKHVLGMLSAEDGVKMRVEVYLEYITINARGKADYLLRRGVRDRA